MISCGMLTQMVSVILWVTLFLGVTDNKVEIQIHNSSNKYRL